MKWLLTGLVVTIVTAGIVFAQPRPSSAVYRDRFLAFHYPRSWRVYHWTIPATEITFIAYVSNARLRDPCTIRTGREFKCGYPIDRLPRGAVLVTWTASHLPGTSDRSSPLSIRRPGPCRYVGADATISELFSGGYYAEACLRGPGIARAERQVREMLSSVDLTGQT